MLTTPIQKVVLTGGPCAGKTTVLHHMQAYYLTEIHMVSEAATRVLETVMRVPGKDTEWTPEWQEVFQQEVLYHQLREEFRAQQLAEMFCKRLILCDRGTLDGAAYTPGGVDAFCQLNGLEAIEELNRYAAVIHLESVATSAPHLYGTAGNTNRFEDLERAQMLEHATRTAWGAHPRWVFIAGSQTIESKVAQVLKVVQALLRGE